MNYAKSVIRQKKRIQELEEWWRNAEDTDKSLAVLSEVIGCLQLNEPKAALNPAMDLLNLAKVMDNEKAKGIAYNLFAAVEMEKGNYRKAQMLCFQATDALGQHNEHSIFTYRILAEICTNQGKYEKGLDYLNQSIQLQSYLTLSKYRPFTNAQMAKIYYRQGNYREALNLCLETLKFSKHSTLLDGWEAFVYHVMGLVYSAQKNYKVTLEKYFDAVKIWEILNNKSQMTGLYTNIGSTYLNQNDTHAAERYYKKALSIDAEHGGNKKLQSLIYQNLGIVYQRFKSETKSLEYYNKALELCKSIGDKLGEMHILFNMCVLFQDDPKKCITQLRKSLKIAETIGDKRFKYMNCVSLAETYAKLEDYKNAYEFQRKAHKMERQLFGMEKTKAIADLENQFKEELKEKELVLLKTHNDELREFTHRAAHEIKEPLRMISSFGKLLERQYNEQLDKKGNEYLSYMLDSSQYLNGFLKDLISYALAGAEILDLKMVDTNDMLITAINNLQLDISENKAEILTEPLPILRASASQVVQIFQNLISNAIKFRSTASPTIQISCAEELDYFKFKVKDNGIGIAPENITRIFNIFNKIHSKREFGGGGIGLAICKKIIEGLGGQIWTESSLGHGSTFFFTIPK